MTLPASARGGRRRRNERGRRLRLASLPPVQIAVYAGLRLVTFAATLVPRAAVPGAGRWLGRSIRRFAPRQAAIARRNLERSRGIVAPDEIDAFLERVYDNLGIRTLELLRLPHAIDHGDVSELARLEGHEVMERAFAMGRGVICLVGHLGSYEKAGIVVAAAGYPLNSLARTLPNPWIDRYLTRLRTRTGNKLIPAHRAAREMIAVLERNEVLVIEIDMDAKQRGVLVELCGRPASLLSSPARLAIRTGAPLLVVDCFREDGVDHVRVDEIIDPKPYEGRPDGVEALTRLIGEHFDRRVRAHPDQWLWLLDRWRGATRRRRRRRRASGGAAPPPPRAFG